MNNAERVKGLHDAWHKLTSEIAERDRHNEIIKELHNKIYELQFDEVKDDNEKTS